MSLNVIHIGNFPFPALPDTSAKLPEQLNCFPGAVSGVFQQEFSALFSIQPFLNIFSYCITEARSASQLFVLQEIIYK